MHDARVTYLRENADQMEKRAYVLKEGGAGSALYTTGKAVGNIMGYMLKPVASVANFGMKTLGKAAIAAPVGVAQGLHTVGKYTGANLIGRNIGKGLIGAAAAPVTAAGVALKEAPVATTLTGGATYMMAPNFWKRFKGQNYMDAVKRPALNGEATAMFGQVH